MSVLVTSAAGENGRGHTVDKPHSAGHPEGKATCIYFGSEPPRSFQLTVGASAGTVMALSKSLFQSRPDVERTAAYG
jgi:hypothetical protein